MVSPGTDVTALVEGRVRDHPEAIACLDAGRPPVTYAEMSALVDRAASALQRAGLGPGIRTVVLVPPGRELLTLLLAVFRLRAVPVVVDPGLPPAAVRACLREAAPEAFIGVPRAQAARLLLGWGRGSVRIAITAGRRKGFGREGPPEWEAPGPGEMALIGYTSGSTGAPKGVPLRYRHLAAQFDLFEHLGVWRPGVPVMSTFPPFMLVGVAFGATAVIPEMDPRRPVHADPAALVRDIRRHGVAGLFAPPALLDRLARHCAARGPVLDSLDDVATAGAPLAMPVLERVRGCLREDARVLSVYGATECMPVAAIDGRELAATGPATARGAGTCLGAPLPGVDVRVIGISDEPITRWNEDLAAAPGTIGEITVASPAVSDPYLNRPGATELARIADGNRTWHRMGDLGRLDERGRLWFAGRRSERVRTSAGDLYTDQVEQVFASVPGVHRVALVEVGREPVLVVEPEPGSSRARIKAAILAADPFGLRDVLFRRRFPVDARHNSKIRRDELAAWARRRR
ncbi:fatty acid CoA ligase family protein [Actinomadura sp. 9N215]|uniref:fatty acid CoA ligase family protein n=1 Tax=Actinomadura sp. 9N215 TaxID=3375150 RepID=UPI0037A51850